MPQLENLTRLTQPMLQPLLAASTAEGYSFIQKLWDEYVSGVNAFDAPGALLLGCHDAGQLVAIGGVHPDPYLNDPQIGRIRHVYVLPDYRRRGLGQTLVQALITRTSDHFHTYTLRTLTDHGHAFYTALGFVDQPRFDAATHWLETGVKDQRHPRGE